MIKRNISKIYHVVQEYNFVVANLRAFSTRRYIYYFLLDKIPLLFSSILIIFYKKLKKRAATPPWSWITRRQSKPSNLTRRYFAWQHASRATLPNCLKMEMEMEEWRSAYLRLTAMCLPEKTIYSHSWARHFFFKIE